LPALVAAAGALIAAPAAAADTRVVSATVFTDAAGTAAPRGVLLSALAACPAYNGPGSLTLYPTGTTDTLPAASTWTLADVLDCGLQIPLSDLTAVQVLRPDGAAEAPLSTDALTNTGDYADPAAPGALPVISNDGGEAQNTYTRPWRGGSDENGSDQVTDSGPLQLLVYENTTPFVVHIATRTLRRGTDRERVALSATVQTTAGATVPATALQFQWTLSTGAASTASAPTETIPKGTATVTLLVSDPAGGGGGTASVALSYKPVRSHTHHAGGGGTGTKRVISGLGGAHHDRRTGASQHGGKRSGGSQTGSTTTTTSATTITATGTATNPTTATTTATTTASTSTATTSTESTATTTRPTKAPRTPHAHATPAHRATHHVTRHAAARGGRLVRGLLLADLVPLSASQSPLTHALSGQATAAVASPAPAGRLTVPGALLGGVAVLGLLGLGGAREHRRRSPSLHR
jgi:hypothetical protein